MTESVSKKGTNTVQTVAGEGPAVFSIQSRDRLAGTQRQRPALGIVQFVVQANSQAGDLVSAAYGLTPAEEYCCGRPARPQRR
jgi:hypothetical protein